MNEEIASEHSTDYGLKELHAVLLESLKDIDSLCKRHNLRYSIYCGTLLGAVRHGGFIPWDDDADLAMPIKDYRRFCRIAPKELREKYVIQNYGNTIQHPWHWTRVCRKGTTFLYKGLSKLKVCHSVAVDIYPLIGAANTLRGYHCQNAVLNIASALQCVDFWRVDGYPRKEYKLIAAIPGFLRRIVSLTLMRIVSFDPERKKRCATLDAAPFAPIFKSFLWNKYTTLNIAGHPFVAPAAYDKILRRIYGDYMTPPPNPERMGHRENSGGLIIDLKNDYTCYLSQNLEASRASDATPGASD